MDILKNISTSSEMNAASKKYNNKISGEKSENRITFKDFLKKEISNKSAQTKNAEENKKTEPSTKSAISDDNISDKDNLTSEVIEKNTIATSDVDGKLAAITSEISPEKSDDQENNTTTSSEPLLNLMNNLSAMQQIEKPAEKAQLKNNSEITKSTAAQIKDITLNKPPEKFEEFSNTKNSALASNHDEKNILATPKEAGEFSSALEKALTPERTIDIKDMHASIQTTNFITKPSEIEPAIIATQNKVGSPPWGQEIGKKIVWMVGQSEQSATITLNPPDLGPMKIVIEVNKTDTRVRFTSDQNEVRQAIESSLPKLREVFQDAGLQLGQATISSGFSENNSSPSTFSRSKHPEIENKKEESTNNKKEVSIEKVRSGLVDIFA
jgi:flagellar hook-length control protein FliK